MHISVLGCGWLGFPAARHLLSLGYSVSGSTTDEKKLPLLDNNEVTPYLIRIENKINCNECTKFWKSDILFLNIPPGRKRGDVLNRHPAQIKAIVEQVKEVGHINWIIFAGSTSVYATYGGITTEEDADPDTASSQSGKALLECEKILKEESTFDTTILRFGGLYGYERHPVKYLAGRKEIDKANRPVNLVHQDDCVQIIGKIIQMNVRNETFNVVSDGHPPRREFYTSAANHFGFETPVFKTDSNEKPTEEYKIVSNKKLKEKLNYSFLYPNPMDHTP